jgi:hypothetical protein
MGGLHVLEAVFLNLVVLLRKADVTVDVKTSLSGTQQMNGR